MFELKTMRNRELMSDYRRYLSAAFAGGSYRGREELIRRMLSECRPHYDATFDYALRMAHRIVRDGLPCRQKGIKAEMWREFCGYVSEIVDRKNCDISEAVATVLAEKRASRYFLTYKQASKIIYHEANNSHNRRRCRA